MSRNGVGNISLATFAMISVQITSFTEQHFA
jgi:hypothetical protein